MSGCDTSKGLVIDLTEAETFINFPIPYIFQLLVDNETIVCSENLGSQQPKYNITISQ